MSDKCCATCKHVYDDGDEPDEPQLRCGYPVPYWVPLPVHDFNSWVYPDDGKNCRAYELKMPNII